MRKLCNPDPLIIHTLTPDSTIIIVNSYDYNDNDIKHNGGANVGYNNNKRVETFKQGLSGSNRYNTNNINTTIKNNSLSIYNKAKKLIRKRSREFKLK